MTRAPAGDAGVSMVEALVSMLLVGVLTALAGTAVVSTSRAVQAGRAQVDVTEEARLALNRMSRELREAARLTGVHTTGSAVTGFTFEVDWDGNGTIVPNAADAERLTYCYRDGQVLLSPAASDCSVVGLPIVTAQVSAFTVGFSSSWAANGLGARTWQELDAAGNANGVLDSAELSRLDTVSIALSVTGGGRTESFSSTVELRNHASG